MPPTAVDSKFGEVTVERGEFHEDEPVFLFRAQDATLPGVLTDFAHRAEAAGSPPSFIAEILNAEQRVRDWQDANQEKVHAPD